MYMYTLIHLEIILYLHLTLFYENKTKEWKLFVS